jgi:hypothetical protein
LKAQRVDVLPLVDNIQRYERVINDFRPGWCTYFYEFADVPEVEFLCGGVNEKTPRASALWRQGNLLHFGFEQSPAEMNATGRALLINAIAYISQFTEDRPITVTPSVFGSEPVATTRRRADHFTDVSRFPDYSMEWLTNVFSSTALNSFNWRDRAAATAWFEEARPWLHPGPGNRLEVDEDAKSLGTLFHTPEFFPRTIQAMREDKTKSKAASLLARYAPEGPGASAGADAWETVVERKCALLILLRNGRLPLVCRSACPEAARSDERPAGTRAGGQAITRVEIFGRKRETVNWCCVGNVHGFCCSCFRRLQPMGFIGLLALTILPLLGLFSLSVHLLRLALEGTLTVSWPETIHCLVALTQVVTTCVLFRYLLAREVRDYVWKPAA